MVILDSGLIFWATLLCMCTNTYMFM